MAAGFPAKANYATGDILTATNMNDLAGTLNLVTSSTLSVSAGKNAVINGGLDIWQRGTSIAIAASTSASSSTYTADRWQTATGTGQAITVSRQATSDTTNLPNIQYGFRFQRNSGQTGTGAIFIGQSFENVNSTPFIGKTVTLSFYARAGANFSAASNGLSVYLNYGTGTDQNVVSGFTGATSTIAQTSILTTTWQRFTYTGTVATTATQLGILFGYAPVGTAGTNDYYEITGVQLELGSTATSFARNGATYQGELSACQRYYYRNAPGTAYGFQGGLAYAQTTAIADTPINLPVAMRIAPNVLETSNISINDGTTYYSSGTWTIVASGNGTQIMTLRYTHGSVVFVLGKIYLSTNNNNTAGYVGLSAEL